IKVTNNTSSNIYVSITASGQDWSNGGNENWITLAANGGTNTWGYRSHWQTIRFTRSQTPGALIETILGVPGANVNIY
ncbi:hypothetical protein F5879DRAFT_766627, partial [Lentinula edodes]